MPWLDVSSFFFLSFFFSMQLTVSEVNTSIGFKENILVGLRSLKLIHS